MKRLGAVLVFVLGLWSPVFAQTVITDPTQATLVWAPASGGGTVTEYHVKCGGITTTVLPPATQTTISSLGLGSGTYTCTVTAWNAAGESDSSNPVTFALGQRPSAPQNLQIQIGAVPPPPGDGGGDSGGSGDSGGTGGTAGGTHVPSWVAYYRWYDNTKQADPAAQAEVTWVAQHYSMVILPTVGKSATWPAALLRQTNPSLDIVWYLDVRGLWSKEEHLADLQAWCQANGVNYEDMFLHATQDIQTSSGLIRGYAPGALNASATSRDQARLYNSSETTRGLMYQMNVGNPQYQQWYADYAVRLADGYGPVKVNGVFGDDAAYELRWQQWWTLNTVAGTSAMLAIAEYPGYATKDAVDAAHVNALASLTAYVSATLKAKNYLFLPNYSATYISGFEPWKSATAWGAVYEGLASLSSNLNYWANNQTYNIFGYIDEYTAAGKRSYFHFRSKLQNDPAHMSGYPANFCTTGYQECLVRERNLGLAAFYMVAGPGLYFDMVASDYSLNPQTDYWFGAEEVDLGAPLGPRNPKWATGTDATDTVNKSTQYQVFAREFEKGLVLFKPMPFYGSYGPDSATTHLLPAGTWYVLNVDGTKSAGPVTQVTLRNAEAVILVKGQ